MGVNNTLVEEEVHQREDDRQKKMDYYKQLLEIHSNRLNFQNKLYFKSWIINTTKYNKPINIYSDYKINKIVEEKKLEEKILNEVSKVKKIEEMYKDRNSKVYIPKSILIYNSEDGNSKENLNSNVKSEIKQADTKICDEILQDFKKFDDLYNEINRKYELKEEKKNDDNITIYDEKEEESLIQCNVEAVRVEPIIGLKKNWYRKINIFIVQYRLRERKK